MFLIPCLSLLFLVDYLLFSLFFDFPHSCFRLPVAVLIHVLGYDGAMFSPLHHLFSLSLTNTHTHAHTLTFSVMLSSCITCIPISIQVPRGSYSGLKTGRAPGISAPWSCDPPSLLLQREHLTTSRGSFCSLQLAPNVGS